MSLSKTETLRQCNEVGEGVNRVAGARSLGTRPSPRLSADRETAWSKQKSLAVPQDIGYADESWRVGWRARKTSPDSAAEVRQKARSGIRRIRPG